MITTDKPSVNTDDSTVRVEIATVKLGLIEIEGVKFPDNTFGVAVPQISDLFLNIRNTASRDLERLLGEEFKTSFGKFPGIKTRVKVVPLDQFNQILITLVVAKNKKAIKFWNAAYPDKKIKHKEKKSVEAKNRGFVYLFENTSYLKLGFSTDIAKRLKTLSRWDGELVLLATIKGTLEVEQKIHRILQQTGKYFGDEWYPVERKEEILTKMKQISPNSFETQPLITL